MEEGGTVRAEEGRHLLASVFIAFPCSYIGGNVHEEPLPCGELDLSLDLECRWVHVAEAVERPALQQMGLLQDNLAWESLDIVGIK